MTKLFERLSLTEPLPDADARDVDAPRRRPDWLMGTGATPVERRLVLGAATVGTLLLGVLAWQSGVSWTWWQWAVAAVIAYDIVGGPVSLGLGSAKRLYGRPLPPYATTGQRLIHHPVVFTAVHVQPFVVALVLPGGAWEWASATYAMALLGVLLVHAVPLYLARPAGFAVVVLCVIVQTVIEAPLGMEWLGPVLLIKLVLAHAVPEHGYRPGDVLPGTRQAIR